MTNIIRSNTVLIVIFLLFFFGIVKVASIAKTKCTVSDTERYTNSITIDDLKVYYEIRGDANKQPLVFIHGWPMKFLGYEPVSFDPVLDELEKHFYVIAVTPPGIIQSQPPDRFWSQEEHARFLHSFINNFQVENPIMMGQSYGGGIVATYAKLYPEETKTLILVDAATGNIGNNPYYRYFPTALPIYKSLLTSKLIPLSTKKCLVHLVHNASEEQLTSDNIPKYANLINDSMGKLDVKYSELKVPLMLVWGKDDEITPLATAEKIHSEVEGSKLVLVEGGHTVLFTDSKTVIDTIVENLQID